MESNPVEHELAPEMEDTVEERISVASQRQLIWWRFRKHRVAVVATAITVIFYTMVPIFSQQMYRRIQRLSGDSCPRSQSISSTGGSRVRTSALYQACATRLPSRRIM